MNTPTAVTIIYDHRSRCGLSRTRDLMWVNQYYYERASDRGRYSSTLGYLLVYNSYLESVQDDKGEKQTERSQYPATGEGENSVGRRADEHPVDLQSQVGSLGSGPVRVQRRGREVYGGNQYARDGRHHPDFSLEAHQHGHHRRYDAGLGREQTHLVAGYLSNRGSNRDRWKSSENQNNNNNAYYYNTIAVRKLQQYTSRVIILLLYIIL